MTCLKALFGICNPEPDKRGFAIRFSPGFRLASAEGGLQIRSYILPDCKSGRAIPGHVSKI
jgi:hypothetical protein